MLLYENRSRGKPVLKENVSVLAKEEEAFLLWTREGEKILLHGIEREKAQVEYSSQEEVIFRQLTCRFRMWKA